MQAILMFQQLHSNWFKIFVDVNRAHTVQDVQLKFEVNINTHVTVIVQFVHLVTYSLLLILVLQKSLSSVVKPVGLPRHVDSDRVRYEFEMKDVQRLEVRASLIF